MSVSVAWALALLSVTLLAGAVAATEARTLCSLRSLPGLRGSRFGSHPLDWGSAFPCLGEATSGPVCKAGFRRLDVTQRR